MLQRPNPEVACYSMFLMLLFGTPSAPGRISFFGVLSFQNSERSVFPPLRLYCKSLLSAPGCDNFESWSTTYGGAETPMGCARLHGVLYGKICPGIAPAIKVPRKNCNSRDRHKKLCPVYNKGVHTTLHFD